jgi:hypothetical protein
VCLTHLVSSDLRAHKFLRWVTKGASAPFFIVFYIVL